MCNTRSLIFIFGERQREISDAFLDIVHVILGIKIILDCEKCKKIHLSASFNEQNGAKSRLCKKRQHTSTLVYRK